MIDGPQRFDLRLCLSQAYSFQTSKKLNLSTLTGLFQGQGGDAFIDDFCKASLKEEGFLIMHDSGRADHIVTSHLHRSAVSCALLLTYYHIYIMDF